MLLLIIIIIIIVVVVGGRGEHSPPGPNGEFDISNKGRIGASEVELGNNNDNNNNWQ